MSRKLNTAQKCPTFLTLLPAESGVELLKFFVHVVIAFLTLSLRLYFRQVGTQGSGILCALFIFLSFSSVFGIQQMVLWKVENFIFQHSRSCPVCPWLNFPVLPLNFPLIPNFITMLWLQKDLGSNLSSPFYCVTRAGCKQNVFHSPFPHLCSKDNNLATNFWLK